MRARAALLFDWDNRWAIQDVKALAETTKCYEKTCISIWKEFMKMGVEMDVVPSDDDFPVMMSLWLPCFTCCSLGPLPV